MAAPVVTSVSPNTGAQAGGTAVTITGSGFTGATAVKFGGVAATSVVVVSDTSITCVAPAGTPGTLVAIAVTTAGGIGTSAGIYTYQGTLFSNYPILRTAGIAIDATGHVWLYRNGALINMGIPPSWTPGLMTADAANADR